jgi:hypothetical protein
VALVAAAMAPGSERAMNRQQRIMHARLWPALGLVVLMGLLLALRARQLPHVEPVHANVTTGHSDAPTSGSTR